MTPCSGDPDATEQEPEGVTEVVRRFEHAMVGADDTITFVRVGRAQKFKTQERWGVIRQLEDDGWELVAAQGSALWFKRPATP